MSKVPSVGYDHDWDCARVAAGKELRRSLGDDYNDEYPDTVRINSYSSNLNSNNTGGTSGSGSSSTAGDRDDDDDSPPSTSRSLKGGL